MGRWEHEMGWDTGSNNSNASTGTPPWFGLDLYDDFSEEQPVTSRWQPIVEGIPASCYCGGPVVVKTQTTGLERGRRFYTCEGDVEDGNFHIYKLWDDAIMEEITDINTKAKVDSEKLKEALKEQKDAHTEHKDWLKEEMQLILNSSYELREIIKTLETKVFGEKDMKIMIGVLLCVIAVLHYYCVYLL